MLVSERLRPELRRSALLRAAVQLCSGRCWSGTYSPGEECQCTPQSQEMELVGRGISTLFAKVCLNPSVYNPR